MFFKNLLLYKLTELLEHSAEDLAAKLQQLAFSPCGKHDESHSGFVPPIGTDLVLAQNGMLMVCLQTETKVMPSSAINKLVDEEVAALEEKQGRKLSKKERTSVKDEVIFDMTQTAFTTISKIHAYIDTQKGFIVVDASSTNKAENVLTYLRRALGSLPCVPLSVKDRPRHVMTAWLDKSPENVVIGSECLLEGEEGEKVKVKNLDLSSREIEEHRSMGREITQIAIDFNDHMTFIINENLQIKRLKFSDEIAFTDAESEEERFDADFSIMTSELSELIDSMIDWFGGLL